VKWRILDGFSRGQGYPLLQCKIKNDGFLTEDISSLKDGISPKLPIDMSQAQLELHGYL
jgi:hypothetical protein